MTVAIDVDKNDTMPSGYEVYIDGAGRQLVPMLWNGPDGLTVLGRL